MNRFEKHEARDKTFRRLEREYERLSRARTGGRWFCTKTTVISNERISSPLNQEDL